MQASRKVLVWSISVILLCSGLIIAQEEESVEVVKPVKLSLTLRGEYTDNRDSLSEDDEEDTFNFYVKPRIDINLDWERAFLDFFYAPSWRYKTDPSDIQNEDEFHHDLGVKGERSLAPGLVIRASEKFDLTDDPSIDEGGTFVRRDQSYILNRADVGLNYELSETWNVDLAVHHMLKEYDKDEVAEDSDEDLTRGTALLINQVTPTFSLFGMGSFSTYGFEAAEGFERDFDSAMFAVGVENVVNPGLRIGAAAGIQTQDYDDDRVDSDDVPYGNVWLAGRMNPDNRLRLDVTHGIRDADAYPFASQEYTDVRARWDWDLLPRVGVYASGVYRFSDYDVSFDSPADETDFAVFEGDETTSIVEGGIAYRFSRKTSLTLVQRYEDVDSDVAEEYTKNSTKLIFGREF
ncbi:MAG: outer membrane beta-barrel protein [Kiritimatiellia bacterium]|jgi:hypothetical protein|nr:outer membrane beta-barrel protein [Kiritimatiellia bacterium]